MSRILVLLSLFAVASAANLFPQKRSQFTTTPPVASVVGRITVRLTVGRTFGEHPVAKLPLYLVRVEDSRAFQELQRKCRRAVARTTSNPGASYEVCVQSMAEAAKLVPQLAATATNQTDRDGFYRFENVPAGGRYQVVGVKYEGDEPVLLVGLTARLKPGEEHRVDISENEAWTDALPPAR